jgi:hypothetical protein
MNGLERNSNSDELRAALCHELLVLARREEDAAAAEASALPYWTSCPPSVVGHRAAARALRADLERLEREAHSLPDAS